MKHHTAGQAAPDDTLWLSHKVNLPDWSEPHRGVLIQFIKGSGQRYSTVVHRRDGVQVEVIAGGYNQVGGSAHRIPHDLAHYIVEDELRLDWGLWGLLAAGALLHPKNTRVIAGRQPPNATLRSKTILDNAGTRPMQVELAVRTAADLALAGQPRDVKQFHALTAGEWGRLPVTADDLERTCHRLQEYGAKWQELAPWQTLDLLWTRLPATR